MTGIAGKTKRVTDIYSKDLFVGIYNIYFVFSP
jgi:hypothetical protein